MTLHLSIIYSESATHRHPRNTTNRPRPFPAHPDSPPAHSHSLGSQRPWFCLGGTKNIFSQKTIKAQKQKKITSKTDVSSPRFFAFRMRPLGHLRRYERQSERHQRVWELRGHIWKWGGSSLEQLSCVLGKQGGKGEQFEGSRGPSVYCRLIASRLYSNDPTTRRKTIANHFEQHSGRTQQHPDAWSGRQKASHQGTLGPLPPLIRTLLLRIKLATLASRLARNGCRAHCRSTQKLWQTNRQQLFCREEDQTVKVSYEEVWVEFM